MADGSSPSAPTKYDLHNFRPAPVHLRRVFSSALNERKRQGRSDRIYGNHRRRHAPDFIFRIILPVNFLIMPDIRVEPEQQGKRLDIFLAERSDCSRGHIQKLIKSGSVLVDGKSSKPNYRLTAGELVTLPELEVEPAIVRRGDAPILNVVFENDDLLVINKPAGLVVHPFEGFDSDTTLVDALLERYPEITDVGDDPARPGIVQRLDKDVSGLMVIAKTAEAFDALKLQFQNRSVYKEYIALVYGVLAKDHDVIEMRIARSKARGRMVARPQSQEGKDAKTEYDMLERFKNHTLVKVILHTGRTHQIRVHFLAINHPLVGDQLYKKIRMKNIRPIALNRIFLHAHKLRFKLMDGTEKTFVEPLPEELSLILTKLK